MNRTIFAALAASVLLTGPALANGNSDAARTMADALSSVPGTGANAPSASGEAFRLYVNDGVGVTDGSKSQNKGKGKGNEPD